MKAVLSCPDWPVLTSPEWFNLKSSFIYFKGEQHHAQLCLVSSCGETLDVGVGLLT